MKKTKDIKARLQVVRTRVRELSQDKLNQVQGGNYDYAEAGVSGYCCCNYTRVTQ
jgi:hypothetical protein